MHKSKLLLTFVFTIGIFSWVVYLSEPTDAAPLLVPDREWSIQLLGGRIEDSSPTLFDLDGDGKQEIIIGTTNKGADPILAVLEDTGAVKWSKTLPDPVYSAPTIADIDPSRPGAEILISTGGNVIDNLKRGSVIAFDRQGNQLWKYDTNDAQGTNTVDGNWASPVAGDVDGDGDMEIVIGSWDRNIYLLDHQGNYIWHYHVADTVWSTAVLVDVDKDGDLEIIIGTDIMAGHALPDGYRPTDGGFVLILDKDGNKLARRQMNETIFSSPAVGDVDGDGDLEIFVGTGTFYFLEGNYTQPFVHGFSIDISGAEWELKDLLGWPKPTAYPGMSSPALADLDGDGDLEVIIGSGYTGLGPPNACSNNPADADCHGALYAWHHNGSPVSGFPTWPTETTGKNGFIRASPVVGDVDGDGDLEVLASLGWEVIVVSKNGVQEHALHTDYTTVASPAIGDLDGDGRTNVVIGSSAHFDDSHGYVFNFEFDANSFNAAALPWPMFHRDAQNSGLAPLAPLLDVTPASLIALQKFGDTSPAVFQIEIRNLGSGTIDWRSTTPASITLTPSSGTVMNSSSTTVTVDMTNFASPPGTLGTFDLGSIEITGISDGQPVEGSPASVSLRLIIVDEIVRAYLPLIVK